MSVSEQVWGRAAGLRRLMQSAFAAACLAIFVLAVVPSGYDPVHIWDKAKHAAAFYVLGLMALVAFPRARPAPIVLGLIGFGGLIELVQALPFVGRDAEWGDLLADAVGAGLAALPLAAAAARRALRTRP